jgi:hypothetical protein
LVINNVLLLARLALERIRRALAYVVVFVLDIPLTLLYFRFILKQVLIITSRGETKVDGLLARQAGLSARLVDPSKRKAE